MPDNKTEGTLHLAIEGIIDAQGAPELERRLTDAIAASPATRVILDARDVTYLSSAGLRVLMRVRKARDLTVENVSSEVYDVLEMTGLTQIMDVHRRPREVSVDGAELIGRGIDGAVFRLDRETIVKVYNAAKNPLDKIRHDRAVSRAVFVQGIDTAIPYDVVKVGDDFGVVFEMVEAETLGHHLACHPEDEQEMAHRMCELLKHLHDTRFQGGVLSDARDLLYARLDAAWTLGAYGDEEVACMRRLVDGIPARDTFVHGDFHPGNIMVRDSELVLIDVGDAGVGHPMLDLMAMGVLFIIAARSGDAERFCGIPGDMLQRMWHQILAEYFDTSDDDEIAHIHEAILSWSSMKVMLGQAARPQVLEALRAQGAIPAKEDFFARVDRMRIVP